MDRLALDSLAKLALIGLFAMIALALTMRGFRAGRSAARLDESGPLPAPPSAPSTLPALSGFATVSDSEQASAIPMLPMAAAQFDFDSPGTGSDDPVARLRRLMKERQEETVQLLNGWIGSDDRTAT